MADDPFVLWTGVPAGSTFKLQCDGKKSDYDFVALVSENGAPEPNIEIDDVNPGPARQPLQKNEKWVISPTLIVTKKLTKAVTLAASIVDGNDQPVQVPDGSGGQIPAEMQWKSGKAAGSTLEVSILIKTEGA